jgi:tetratricopeptide (TPR) repeat protein
MEFQARRVNGTGTTLTFDTALSLYNELLAKWPDQKPLVDKMDAAIAINKAAAYQNMGNLDQALVTYQQALPTMIALARSPNAHQSDMRALANVYNSLGATLSIQLAHDKNMNRATRIQKAKQVLDYLAGAWALSEHLAKADPSNGLESANLVAVQKNLQTACLNMGLPGDTNACLNRAGIRIAPLP